MFKKVLRAYGPYKWKVLPIFFFLLVFEGLDLLVPYFFGQVVDLVYRKMEFLVILGVIGLAAGTALGRQILAILKDFYELRNIDYQLENHIQHETLEKLFQLSIGQHRDKNSGVAEATIVKGERAMKLATDTVLYQLSPLILQILVTTTALIVLDPLTGLVLATGMVIHITMSMTIGYKFIPPITKSMDMDDNDSGRHREIIGASAVIIAAAQEKQVIKQFVERLENTAIFKVKVWSQYMFWNIGRSVLGNLLRPIAVTIAVWQVSQGSYGPGHMVVILMWAGHAIANIGSIPYFHRQLLNHWGAIKNYFALLEIPPRVKMIKNPKPFSCLATGITLENVGFTYGFDNKEEGKEIKPALIGINLFIPRGVRAALVGPSGSGKSTLVNLFLRGDDPTTGQILVDGTNLRELDLYDWRSRIGFVEQQVTLFDDTIGENIKFGLNGRSKEIDEQDLDKVARLARIDKFYHRLNDGFNTVIGEDGIKLSGGERQRVGIARALIKDPNIIIFDEATSNLDTENESVIKQSIDEAVAGRTAIFIAHRLSTVRDADLIVVMDEGQVVATGTHEELLKNCGLYQKLVSLQELH
ncbi:MAG: ABC transporter ATP-binding protein [bacterium]|nr:ABC transporter ATP-binding protein [bacterium]